MKRRRFLGAGLAAAGLLLVGHTPYGQWSVYRQRHLLILTNRSDGSYPLGKQIAAVLAAYLPESGSRVARAPNLLRVASLLGTKQMDVALLRADDAGALLRGVGLFADVGSVALRTIVTLEDYLLVCREDFPDIHAYQLARTLTDLTVIATASRPETASWVKTLGAHHVVDHSKPLAQEVARLGVGAPAFVFSTTQTDKHYDQIVEIISSQGRFGLIDDPDLIDMRKLKRKSASLHWEFMFTRPMFETADVAEQNKLLTKVAELVDAGKIKTTLTETYGVINAANLRRAHALIESGKARGKIVLEGF